mmetsp:Transcript_18457/g.48979  ORF Transcript_18457/g.48979 Transcript_18457/m.48979 type:complete len:296 (+) Transcript_18457:2555-3442(+)
MEPRFATFWYSSLFLSISMDVFLAVSRASPISIDFVFALRSVWMSSSLSRMLPLEAASSRRRVSSRDCLTCRFSDICCTVLCLSSSRSGRSKPTTTFRSCAARPSRVMTQFTMEALPITSGVYLGLLSFVVIISTKLSFHSIWLSPRVMTFCPFKSTNRFSRMGSIMGSSSSSRFSKRKVLPYWIASSKNFVNSSLNVFTMSPLFSSLRLIHCTICICGSTQRGQRADCVTRMPFCTQSSSLGSPWPDHAAISTSEVSSVSSLKSSVCWICFCATSASQFLYTISVLNSWLKGPA